MVESDLTATLPESSIAHMSYRLEVTRRFEKDLGKSQLKHHL